MGQDTLLHGETLFVVPTTDSDHITLPFFTQSVSSNFCGHTLLIKSTEVLRSSSTSMSFWQPVAGKEMFSFILKQLNASKAPRKRAETSSIGSGFAHLVLT
uniref:Macaca fascicularis brain cDNA clone: QflA-16395, similar to human ribosomal protein S6 (RPS6), mRNA, RefSeq: NM_001010.2 n=1 Tax=Macaca fascicularis TaxID=9541 RepID=I7GI15_MACFA|nr:unnamed protein product [Macaca fascicularis]